MNWTAVGVMLGGGSTIGGILYFALRSFIRAELAEQRLAIMNHINGAYLRKDVADSEFAGIRRDLEQLERLWPGRVTGSGLRPGSSPAPGEI